MKFPVDDRSDFLFNPSKVHIGRMRFSIEFDNTVRSFINTWHAIEQWHNGETHKLIWNIHNTANINIRAKFPLYMVPVTYMFPDKCNYSSRTLKGKWIPSVGGVILDLFYQCTHSIAFLKKDLLHSVDFFCSGHFLRKSLQHKSDKNSPIRGWGGLSKMSKKSPKCP